MEVETVTPVKKNIFDVEIIERKRKSKRKAAVEELFQSLKKRRKSEVREDPLHKQLSEHSSYVLLIMQFHNLKNLERRKLISLISVHRI